MALQIAKPSGQPALKDRVVAFGREHGWLCAGCLIALIAVTAEGRKPEDQELARYRQEIAALTADEMKELRLHAVEFSQLSREEQAAAQALHQHVTAHPEEAQTLSEFHNWLNTLPKERRTAITSAKEPQVWLTAIREMRTPRNDGMRFGPGTPGSIFGKQSNPGFGKGKPVFETLMRGLARTYSMPEEDADHSKLGRWENHIRIVDRAFREHAGKDRVEEKNNDELLRVLRESVGRDALDRLQGGGRVVMRMMAINLLNEGAELVEEDSKLRAKFESETPAFLRDDLPRFRPDDAGRRLAMSHIRTVAPSLEDRIKMVLSSDEGEGPAFEFGPDGGSNFGPPDGPRSGRPRFNGRPGERGVDGDLPPRDGLPGGGRPRPDGPPPRNKEPL